jgi:tetratricopeptide (TPR) repeat protein
MNSNPIRCYFLQESGSDTGFWEGLLSKIRDEDMEFLHLQGLEDARRVIGERIPDAIAVGLPGMDSLPFLLEASNLAPGVPAIAVTDNGDPRFPFRVCQDGAEDCLVKGEGDVDSLGRRLALMVRRHVLDWRLRQLYNLGEKPQHPAAARQRLADISSTAKEMSRVYQLLSLENMEVRLLASPADVRVHYSRARLLKELGRAAEAVPVFGRILELSPSLLGKADDPEGLFLSALSEALRYHPRHIQGHLSLAGLLREKGRNDEARAEFELILKLEPDCLEARQALALLPPPEKGVKSRRGVPPPLPVLLLTTASSGNSPLYYLLNDGTFRTWSLAADFCLPNQALPPHRLVVNSIGDADLCGPALRAAQAIVVRSGAPVVNPPSRVLATGRADSAVLLRGIPGVVTADTVHLPKDLLAKPEGSAEIVRRGFSYPFLLRSPGYHLGRYFRLVSNEKELAPAVASLPGSELTVIRYLDGRGQDGKMRKYRVMMIGGELYPAHLALSSEHWKVHYVSADMDDGPKNRAEDEAFLRDMKSAIGERALRAIEGIRDRLALDYAGVDFGLDGEGNLLLYEANACMYVPPPDSDPKWDYRRAPVARILEATRQMVHQKAAG